MEWFELIIDFCIKHWRAILSIVCAIISVVFYIIRRRPTYNGIDAIKTDVLEILPKLICSVEIDGNGPRKKSAVIEAVKNYVQKKYGIEFPAGLMLFLDSSLEDILSTPQKKGTVEDAEKTRK